MSCAVRVERAVLDRCARLRAIAIHPAGMGFAIKEQQPAIATLRIGQGIFRSLSESSGSRETDRGEENGFQILRSVSTSRGIERPTFTHSRINDGRCLQPTEASTPGSR